MTDLIDLKWAKIDDEWVIYKEELDEWVKTKGIPKCPVCENIKAGMKNIRMEGNIKRGNCANCGARLAIIMASGKFVVLKKFKYGSVSDPKTMIPSDAEVSAANFTNEQLDKWAKLGWIRRVL